MDKRIITIVDCFISNDSVLTKLKTSLYNLKHHGHTILLISNTVPSKEIISLVDYFIYNHENKLFNYNYEDIKYVDLWKSFPEMVIHEITEEFQKHGLSVLCNLFNGLDFSKSLGFTHFQRIEVDDLYTDESYEFMKRVPQLCDNENKKSLFYKNYDDVSFHYYYSEIDFFIDNFFRIKNENDYRNYLEIFGHKSSFKPVEVYMFDNLNKIEQSKVMVRNGISDMNNDFEGTVWNTESSKSTLHEKYEGCTSKLYNIKNQNGICVLTYNHNNHPVGRKIIVKLKDKTDQLHHSLQFVNSWSYNIYYEEVEGIEVYDLETNKFLYTSNNIDIKDYIELK